MNPIVAYIWGVASEGVVVALLFWCITYITIESTSLRGALRAGLISEAIGNIPYIFAVPAVSPPGIAMALVGAFIFIRVILRVGELTPLKAGYGVGMTYFVLLAIVSCA